MSEDMFKFAFVGGIVLSVVATLVAVWIQPAKGPGAWLMAASTVFFALGVGGLVWTALADPVMYSDASPMVYLGFAATFGTLTLAVILFSVGFLWEQIARSAA